MEPKDVIIVGGGLAGLTATALLSRVGKRVVLLDKASTLGGRARSQHHKGFVFNLGPHALYKNGIASRIYRELNLSLPSGEPDVGSGLIYSKGKLHPIPFSPFRLLSSRLFTWVEKWEMLQILRQISVLNPQEQAGQSLADWLAKNALSANVEQFLQAVLRLTSYSADIELLDAGLALAQFQLSSGGVEYLNGGWQMLVDELVRVAHSGGAELLKERLFQEFWAACQGKDINNLIHLLAENCRFYSDGGGKVPAALKPVCGRDRVLAFIFNIQKQAPSDFQPVFIELNGEPGLMIMQSDHLEYTLTVHVEAGQILELYTVRNPNKLHRISLDGSPR